MLHRRTKVLVGAALLEAGRGGIARVARASISALAHGGYDVTALSFLDRKMSAIDGAKSLTASGSKLRFATSCYRHALTADFALYDSAGIARGRPRLPGLRRPFAVWMHGIEAWEALKPQAHASYRDASLVFVNSAHTLRRFEALHGPLPQARICPLGTETDDPPAITRRIEGAPPTTMILGRIVKAESGKGHVELITAWSDVVARVPDARLVIAGGGDGLDTIRDFAAGSPAAKHIDVLGFVPEHEIEALWARTHVFAMPSHTEGFGLVFVEAMRHGIPVIASTHDAGCEVNVHGVTGYNVDPADETNLADRLIALLADPDHAASLGQNGFALWQERYCFSAFRARFLALIATMSR